MSIQIVTVPCLQDNYAYLLHDSQSKQTALVDAPESEAILDALSQHGWSLDQIWLTHHHWDHVDGLGGILSRHSAKVYGAKTDAHRLPPLDHALCDQEQFQFAGQEVRVLDVSGHTIGHIAFYLPQSDALFSADSLMALGCGRLFEGTPAQMHASLQKTSEMPAQTRLYSGHEYTASNAAFALSIDPNNEALKQRAQQIAEKRAKSLPTIPSHLKDERETNPFLRAHDPEIKKMLNMQDASEVEVFTEIRRRKDEF